VASIRNASRTNRGASRTLFQNSCCAAMGQTSAEPVAPPLPDQPMELVSNPRPTQNQVGTKTNVPETIKILSGMKLSRKQPEQVPAADRFLMPRWAVQSPRSPSQARRHHCVVFQGNGSKGAAFRRGRKRSRSTKRKPRA
jgi:hypothetical protein